MSTSTILRRPKAPASTATLDIAALRARFEEDADVQATRARDRQAQADVREARTAVETLDAELRAPASERTRGTLRIQADRQDAAIRLEAALDAARAAREAREAAEQRVRHKMVRPALAPHIETAIRVLYARLRDAARANDELQRLEAAERDLLRVGAGQTLSWPELLDNSSGSSRLQAYPRLAAQERGIDLSES